MKRSMEFLLQHPVPQQIDEIKCFNTISLEKDVDGVTTEGFGNMAMGLSAFGSLHTFRHYAHT